jgi:predicted CoA-binding protein
MIDRHPVRLRSILQSVKTIAMVGASSNRASTAIGSVTTLFSL